MPSKPRSLEEAKELLGARPGVAGVGQGEGKMVVVMLEREDFFLRKEIHAELSLLPHRITVAGRFEARRR